MMEVGYDVLVSACTAILLAFMVAKLVSMAVCGGGEELLSGVGNGGNRTSFGGGGGGGVEVVKSEKRLKVDGLKIKKKKVKNMSDDRALVSELIAESAVAANLGGLRNADDDDGEGFASVQQDIRFLGVEVDAAYMRDEASGITSSGEISSAGEAGGVELSEIRKGDDEFALDRSSEGLKEEIGRPIEGYDQVNVSARDLDEPIGHDDSRNFQKDDEIREETLNCDFQEKETDLNGTKNRGVDEHRRVSESVETQWKDQSEEVDDGDEEIACSDSKVKGEMEISDGEEWEGIETNELQRDFAKAMNFVQCSDKEGGLNKLGSDVLMEFEGLQKAAIEGVCLDLPARAKWNPWTKSWSTNQEEAMEKYIALLSGKVPGWMDEISPAEGSINLEKDGESDSLDANLCKPLTLPPISTDDSKTEEENATKADRLSSINKEEK